MIAFLVSPEVNLIERIVNYLYVDEKDYSSNLIVFPGKRPSYFLRKEIAKKEGSSFLPPKIFSMDEFIDYIYLEVIGRKRKIETIDALTILYEIHKGSKDPIGHKDFLDLDTFLPIGIKIYNDIEELCIEGIESKRLKEIDHIVEEKIPLESKKRLQSLSYFYENFYKKIEEYNCSTRSSRYRDVSLNIENFDISGFHKIIFAGFFGLTKSEKRIFNFFKGKEEAIFFFQDGFGLDLSSFAIRPEIEEVKIKHKPDIHIYNSPDTHGQVFCVGKILKEKIDRQERIDEKTVIVLPSAETLFPLFHHALNLLGPGQYNISLGYPLERTPLWRLIKILMELIISMGEETVFVPNYLNFVLHPYIKNIYFERKAEITRIMFHSIEEALTIKGTKKFMSLKEIEEDETIDSYLKERISGVSILKLKDHLRWIHENTIKKFMCFKNIGEFCGKLIELIQFIYENSTARLHPFFYPYCEKFITELYIISKSLMKDLSFKDTGSYFNLIKHTIVNSYTPFSGTPINGLQVLGFLETRNIKFERVFFLDLNEGIVPETRKEDTFLPLKVRRILGIPTYLEREKLISYYFDVLIKGAKEVHLFYVENKEKERSRIIERVLWEMQKEKRSTDEGEFLKLIQYQIDLKVKKPRYIEKSPEIIKWLKNYNFSASSLDRYLSCPLGFYYEYVLGLKERETISEDIERKEIGSVVHDILFEFFREKTDKILSEEDMDIDELGKIVVKTFEQRFGKEPTGELYLIRRQVEEHLNDFIKNYQIPRIKSIPTKIIGLERRITIEKDSFKLNARLDRIEKRNEKTVIIDYKTSANKRFLSIDFNKLIPEKRESWGDAIATLQLPFYLTVYSEFTGENPKQIDCIFLLLGKNMIDNSIELSLFEDDNDREKKFLIMNKIIFSLLNEIVDPDKPFLPTYNQKEICVGCLYKHICKN